MQMTVVYCDSCQGSCRCFVKSAVVLVAFSKDIASAYNIALEPLGGLHIQPSIGSSAGKGYGLLPGQEKRQQPLLCLFVSK